MNTSCARCNRPLSDPASIAVGIGPICAVKRAAESRPAGIHAARYDVVKVTEECVWITDVGQDCRSVTNDAEAVVTVLAAEYGARRIIYRDSMGMWDELKHEGCVFTGFAPARDLAPAGVS